MTVTYLTSWQFLLNTIDSEFSPVIIQYGRSIENELNTIFKTIDPAKNWMIGKMQVSLEWFKTGTRSSNCCNATEFAALQSLLTSTFNTPLDLKIELLEDILTIRNSAAHPGQSKSRQEAVDYILKAEQFLDKWIDLKRSKTYQVDQYHLNVYHTSIL